MKHLLIVLFLAVPSTINAQGCSDAGFCSIGDLKSSSTSTTDLSINSIAVGVSYGIGLEATQIITPYFEYQRKISNSFQLQGKVTAGFANGELGSNFGAGDIFLTGSYVLSQKDKLKFSVLAGIKVPLNNSNNKNKNNLPLPLDYQSSLATYDAIVGTRAGIRNFEIQAGLQMPVVQLNENTFFPYLYDDLSAYKYSPTNEYERKSDVLFRIGYHVTFEKNNLFFTPNLLGIYHLENDTYKDETGKRVTITDSKGFTLNAGLVSAKSFKNNHEMEVLVAFPLVVREVRPDGLTRSLVINFQYKIPF